MLSKDTVEVRSEKANVQTYTYFEFYFIPCNEFREVDECYQDDEVNEYWIKTPPIIGMNFLYE